MMRKILRWCYHSVPGTYFVMVHHVKNTTEGISPCIISIDRFIEYIERRSFVNITDALQNPWGNDGKYVLTFDDGCEDLYTAVYPILKERRIPFTAFLSSEKIGEEGYITKDQLVEMANDSLVTIGSHGMYHKKLTECTDKEAKIEIEQSKHSIEKIINRPIKYFAYPNGAAGKREYRYVREAGYKYAFGVVPRKTNGFAVVLMRFQMPRYNLTNECSNPC